MYDTEEWEKAKRICSWLQYPGRGKKLYKNGEVGYICKDVNNGKEMIFCVKVSRLTGVRVCTVYTTTAPVVQ